MKKLTIGLLEKIQLHLSGKHPYIFLPERTKALIILFKALK